jgi:hypothetical protein
VFFGANNYLNGLINQLVNEWIENLEFL